MSRQKIDWSWLYTALKLTCIAAIVVAAFGLPALPLPSATRNITALPLLINKAEAAEPPFCSRAPYLDDPEGPWVHDFKLLTQRGNEALANGQLAQAKMEYDRALAVAERCAKADPNSPDWQLDLSTSYDKIGGVLAAQDNLPEALKSYRDALAIMERLVKIDPDELDWQRDLSVSYNKVGEVLVRQNKPQEALKSYASALAIMERLVKIDPGTLGWQRDLAATYSKLAGAFMIGGEKAKALDALRHGRSIVERLSSLWPQEPVLKDDLAWFDELIAELSR